MNRIPYLAAVGLAAVSITFSACETPGQGAAIGAGTGAVIGAIAGGDIRAAAIGAGAGAAAGALIGKANQEQRRREYPGYEADRAYAAGYAPAEPVARPSSRRGYVISPYPPYALVDVRHIPRGARVLDPASKRVFINP